MTSEQRNTRPAIEQTRRGRADAPSDLLRARTQFAVVDSPPLPTEVPAAN
jgi:hypothetical protein